MTGPHECEKTTHPPAYVPAQAAMNRLAGIALLLGIVLAPVGIVAGHIALKQITRTGERGHGMALAGTVVGYVLAVLGLVAVVLLWILFAALDSSFRPDAL